MLARYAVEITSRPRVISGSITQLYNAGILTDSFSPIFLGKGVEAIIRIINVTAYCVIHNKALPLIIGRPLIKNIFLKLFKSAVVSSKANIPHPIIISTSAYICCISAGQNPVKNQTIIILRH